MTVASLSGRVFGKLIVLAIVESTLGERVERKWLVSCRCGSITTATTNSLVSGRKKSCGCLVGEMLRKRVTTHGKSNTRAFNAWRNMIQRCERASHPQYHHYGGRGIGVCERWHNASAFLEDMGEPLPGYSLERINNDLGYSPENCRWATQKEQLRNRRNTIWATFAGERKSLSEWCDIRCLNYIAISARLRFGMSPEEAITKGAPKYSRSPIGKKVAT